MTVNELLIVVQPLHVELLIDEQMGAVDEIPFIAAE